MHRGGVQIEHDWAAIFVASHLTTIIVLVPKRVVDRDGRHVQASQPTATHKEQVLVRAGYCHLLLLPHLADDLRHLRLLLLNVELESAVKGEGHASIYDRRVMSLLNLGI